jgi:hypothetical protein
MFHFEDAKLIEDLSELEEVPQGQADQEECGEAEGFMENQPSNRNAFDRVFQFVKPRQWQRLLQAVVEPVALNLAIFRPGVAGFNTCV